MAKEPAEDPIARFVADEAKQQSAKKWFDRAATLVEQRNYDFAIKCFTEGLALNPEAVQDGYVPLRGCSVARWQTGGKKAGAIDAVKHSMTTKDPLKGLINAAWLLAHDPNSPTYAEGLLKNANKAHCDDALFWIGPIYREIIGNEKKPNPKKFAALKDIYEELGDRCRDRGELPLALKAYELGLEALNHQRALDPKNRELDNVIRDLSTKLTILKGNYDTADSFRSSVLDGDKQAQLHDVDRLVQSESSLKLAIDSARRAMEQNPGEDAKVIAYVDLLCKDESDQREKDAIALLTQKYQESNNYRFKQKADDIAIRQLGRHARAARAAGEDERYKQLAVRHLKFEENVYRERVQKYPTDLRLKYEFGKRLFRTRKYDDAIPCFQQARSDPKVRTACSLLLGRCFFEQKLPDQAVAVLTEAINLYELTEDETAKELNYWLARSLEAGNRPDEARQAYGKLMQIDYNYRDIRDRIKNLS